jgi:CheY-like chemotaxis protein
MLNNQDSMSQSDCQRVALGTVLVLEDEVMVSMAIEDLVREIGADDVLVLADPTPALEAIQGRKIDMAVLDVHLGAKTSFAVADALEARGIPYVFSSALGSVAVGERYRHRPMLSKPFADEELRAHLLSLVPR